MIRRIFAITLVCITLAGCAGFITRSNHESELYSPAVAATEAGDVASLQSLLDRDPKLVLTREWDERTLLIDAANRGRDGVVEILLERKADINAMDKDGRTALHVAAQNGNISTIQLLLKRGAEPNRKDKFGWTPADRAQKWRQAGALKVLMEHGALLGQN